MGEPTRIQVVRRAELAAVHAPEWADPESLAAFHPNKRRALLENPYAQSADDPVQVVAVQGGRVVGKMDLIQGRAVVAGQAVPVLWASSLFVPPEHRKTMAGVLLVMKMQQIHPACAVCGVSAAALPIYEKLKWIDLPMARLVWLRASRPLVERYIGAGPLGSAARVLADAGLLVHRAAVSSVIHARANGLRLERHEALPEDLAPAVARGVGSGPAFARDKAWVDWVARHALDATEQIAKSLVVVRDGSGDGVGYFIAKCRFYESATQRQLKNLLLASVQDWMTFDTARLPEATLVLLAARYAAGLSPQAHPRRPDAVEVCTRDSALARRLRTLGFAPAGLLHLLYKASSASPLSAIGPDQGDRWRTRPGEGDNAFA